MHKIYKEVYIKYGLKTIYTKFMLQLENFFHAFWSTFLTIQLSCLMEI